MIDRLLTPVEAQRILGIPRSTVSTWHSRRSRTGLYPAGIDQHGHPLFRTSDLLRLRSGRSIRDAAGELDVGCPDEPAACFPGVSTCVHP